MDAETTPLGGIERCIISLSRALTNSNLKVRVFSNVNNDIEFKQITWSPKDKLTNFKADIVIACNDPKLFDVYAKNSDHKNFKPYLWHHNPVSYWKTIRKSRLLPLIRWNPTTIFLGTYHQNQYPFLLPAKNPTIIKHGIEDSILNYPTSDSMLPPPPHAAFISQSYRGLEEMVSLWKNSISPQNPDAKLFVYSETQYKRNDLSNYGIYFEGRQPRENLIRSLSQIRLVLTPGHPDETFCLSALESQCLGIPVITFGIGALKERVKDGYDGFIAKDNKDFTNKINDVLNNNDTWSHLSTNAILHKKDSSWSKKSAQWIELFGKN